METAEKKGTAGRGVRPRTPKTPTHPLPWRRAGRRTACLRTTLFQLEKKINITRAGLTNKAKRFNSSVLFFFFLMPDVGANQFQPRRSPYSSSKQPHVPLTPTAHSSPGLAAPHFNVFSPQPPQATAFCNLYLSCPPPRVISASRSLGDVVPPRRTARGSEPSPSNYWFWS